MLTEFLLYGISPYRQTFQVTEQLEGLQLSQPLELVQEYLSCTKFHVLNFMFTYCLYFPQLNWIGRKGCGIVIRA